MLKGKEMLITIRNQKKNYSITDPEIVEMTELSNNGNVKIFI